MAGCSSLRCAGVAKGWPLSTLATSSSIYRKTAIGIVTKLAISAVVDDKEKVRRRLEEAGVETLPGRGVEFRDPWGNRVQIVEYGDIQFTKHRAVLKGMGCADLHKSPAALEELSRKGIAIEET
jgi:hypothetical protein